VPSPIPLLPELVAALEPAASHFRRLGLLPSVRAAAPAEIVSEVSVAWAGVTDVPALRVWLAAHAVRVERLDEAAGLYPAYVDAAGEAGPSAHRAA
jgi:hypothetical protein